MSNLTPKTTPRFYKKLDSRIGRLGTAPNI